MTLELQHTAFQTYQCGWYEETLGPTIFPLAPATIIPTLTVFKAKFSWTFQIIHISKYNIMTHHLYKVNFGFFLIQKALL